MTHQNLPEPEKRQCERYDEELGICYDFPYGLPEKVAATIKYTYEGQEKSKPSIGHTRNICANGLCLTTPCKLEAGKKLNLELALPKPRKPIHMVGEVRWCEAACKNAQDQQLYSSGIKILTVEGQSVQKSIGYDKEHRVVWSNVLDVVYGTFQKLMKDQ